MINDRNNKYQDVEMVVRKDFDSKVLYLDETFDVAVVLGRYPYGLVALEAIPSGEQTYAPESLYERVINIGNIPELKKNLKRKHHQTPRSARLKSGERFTDLDKKQKEPFPKWVYPSWTYPSGSPLKLNISRLWECSDNAFYAGVVREQWSALGGMVLQMKSLASTEEHQWFVDMENTDDYLMGVVDAEYIAEVAKHFEQRMGIKQPFVNKNCTAIRSLVHYADMHNIYVPHSLREIQDGFRIEKGRVTLNSMKQARPVLTNSEEEPMFRRQSIRTRKPNKKIIDITDGMPDNPVWNDVREVVRRVNMTPDEKRAREKATEFATNYCLDEMSDAKKDGRLPVFDVQTIQQLYVTRDKDAISAISAVVAKFGGVQRGER
ncbi:hypothetical protein FACS189425_01880 [Clostridia bacterium]|nr:hypothetical protein FACS189425_01880 [Clostridia bacterium]